MQNTLIEATVDPWNREDDALLRTFEKDMGTDGNPLGTHEGQKAQGMLVAEWYSDSIHGSIETTGPGGYPCIVVWECIPAAHADAQGRHTVPASDDAAWERLTLETFETVAEARRVYEGMCNEKVIEAFAEDTN